MAAWDDPYMLVQQDSALRRAAERAAETRQALLAAMSCHADPTHGASVWAVWHCPECKPPVGLCAACDKFRHAGKGPLSQHVRKEMTRVECQGADDCPHPAIVTCPDFCGKLCDQCDRKRHAQSHFADHPPRELLEVCMVFTLCMYVCMYVCVCVDRKSNV